MVKIDISEKYIRMCSLGKEIQQKWNYENGDYVYDTIDGDAGVWYWHLSKDISECIWLPRHDQLQEICIQFFMQNLKISEFEALLRFLEWYSGCLRYAFEHSLQNYDYGFIDSSEEILLNEAMKMLHGKKWGGETWVKAAEVM
jgi:hypothetical protein